MRGLQLNPRQHQVLRSVIDTLIPAIDTQRGDHPDFWLRKASDLNVDQHIVETIAVLPHAARRDFARLLTLFASPLPGLLMGGRPCSIDGLAPERREALLLRWASSQIPLLRMAFASLKRITCFIHYGSSAAGSNPNWLALGYPGPIQEVVASPPASSLRISVPSACIDCDTVVIGSGAGGGVVAGVLAARGQDVVVVDKGAYVPAAERNNLEFDMVSRLYEGRGMQTNSDQSISLFAGSCLGGGTTVNWSASLRPGQALLHEWAEQHGLPELLSREFEQCVDDVCAHIGVVDEVPHNAQNRALLAGSAQLGYAAGPLPQNVRGCERHAHDRCGYCLFGCRYGYKQDVTEAFLRQPPGLHAARIHTDTQVLRLHHHHGEVTHAEARVLVKPGVERPVTIRARRYVLAAGAIHSPALLLASGLSHPHLGRHLYVHPAALLLGQYARRMESWRGGMMTSYCDVAADQDGERYGCKIETAPLHGGLLAVALPWRGGRQHKELMLSAAHYAGLAVITRDRHGGRVGLDREGRPRIHYQLHEYDRRHAIHGMAAAAAIHAAAGAERVLTTHQDGLAFDVRQAPRDVVGYAAALAALDWTPNRFPLFSSHLMGTCRMGGRRADSPVSPDGCWSGIQNLYVADGSVFPSASGINPMITIQALARHTALKIAAA